MGWGRRGHDTHGDLEQDEQGAAEAARAHLVEERRVAGDRLERRYNEVGARGWEPMSVLPLTQFAFSSGGHTTCTRLCCLRGLWILP
jgi:hypothetical protein